MSTINSELIRYSDYTGYYINYRIRLTQIESDSAGKVKITMQGYEATSSSPVASIPARPYRIAADAAMQNIIAESENAAFGIAKTVSIDNAQLEQTLYINWGYFGSTAISLSPFAAAFTLTVSKGEGVESVSVERSASAVAEAGQIESGAIVYTGDALDISAEAESGYKLQEFDTPVTVSGDTEISILAAVGSNTEVFDGTAWAKYQIEVYNGSEWGVYQPQVFNGSEWEQY